MSQQWSGGGRCGLLLGLLALLAQGPRGGPRGTWGAQDTDRFTYQETDTSGSDPLYGPADWDRVGCSDLASCPGWPDKYEAAIDWALDSNDCQWCPADGGSCGTHHQSPINLERNRAINESEWHNQCVDVHWMKYYDSSCTWDELVRLDAFSIERHSLKLTQPVEAFSGAADTSESGGNTGAYRNACEDADGKHYFGRIDFSKGFSQWWYLSHMNLHVPSEHTQEGRRYDGELQFHHFYSVSAAEAGVANQMSTLGIFLQAYDDAPDYDVLNKLICQWRRVEDATREQCDLPSVESYYPGCFFNTRGHSASARRNLRKDAASSKAASLQDVVAQKRPAASRDAPAGPHASLRDDFEEPSDFDWDTFIRDVYRQEEERAGARHLLDYDHVGPWHNYFGMLGVKTEYYFRYSGTQTIPPCYGIFTPGNNRANTNHWRVMKDPIRVSVRQIDELHRLLKDRIAPSDDPINACQPDTAAAPYEGNENRVNVSRPLMMTDKAHFMTFCECRWGSKWVEDQIWCDDKNQTSRLYDHPYNFPTDDF